MTATDVRPDDRLAWPAEAVRTQESYTVSFTFNLTPPLAALLFDGPMRLWWEMAQLYRPLWWMEER